MNNVAEVLWGCNRSNDSNTWTRLYFNKSLNLEIVGAEFYWKQLCERNARQYFLNCKYFQWKCLWIDHVIINVCHWFVKTNHVYVIAIPISLQAADLQNMSYVAIVASAVRSDETWILVKDQRNGYSDWPLPNKYGCTFFWNINHL